MNRERKESASTSRPKHPILSFINGVTGEASVWIGLGMGSLYWQLLRS
jgi:hypothetical protein